VVYLNCNMGKVVKPAGWDPWGKESNKKTAFYAEYNNKGDGFKPLERVEWSHQLTNEQAKQYDIAQVLKGWDPRTVQ
jgi:pectinesterase